jgi:hypothetical protein
MQILRVVLPFFLALLPLSLLAVESNAPGPNSEPFYAQLRSVQPDGEAYEVHNLTLVRDVGTFQLKSGTLCLLKPANGMITGALFRGDGSFSLKTSDPREQNQMRMLTKGPGVEDEFEKLVLRFADGTASELKGAMTAKSSAGCAADALEESQKHLRTELHYNLAARLLQPVLAQQPDGFFLALFSGKNYGKLRFEIDPRGARYLQPEEVELVAFNESKSGIWYGGHLLTEAREGWRVKEPAHESSFVKPVKHEIDATIERNGTLSATSTETFVSQIDGLRVVPFSLFPKLRVSKVTDAQGNALGWIQEKEKEDGDYFVVLARPAAKGEQLQITTSYAGKDAVYHTGDGNYYPVWRESWYPNMGVPFRDYASYRLTFRVPKNLTVTATGTQTSQHNDGNQSVTEWKTDGPISVAGFNLGEFKSESAKLDKEGVQVTAYVNREIPDSFKAILQRADGTAPSASTMQGSPALALGSMSTTPMLKRSLAEGSLAVRLYTDYFGPMSEKELQITQQTAGNYGQAWPGLVFLPIYYFLDDTQRHQLGLDAQKSQYWKVVEPHEVAHEWWGHSVGWTSYRDQWMSEGFADFSASLFIQFIRNDRSEYLHFWNVMREELTQKDSWGHRPTDLGSLTMGYRLHTGLADGWSGHHVIYYKGAYILHMLRQMMVDPKTGDADFKAMIHDFISSHRNQPVTTEDFKAAVERHIKPQMDLDHNGKMDWFFDEWVYGTEVPSYSMESSIENSADGKGGAITMKITQSGVGPNFKMLVPVYVEFSDGRVGFLGRVSLAGNQTITQKIPFSAVQPKRLMINYNLDVLSAN